MPDPTGTSLDPNEVLSLHEAVAELGVEPNLLVRAISKGRLEGIKIGMGQGFRILRSDLTTYVNSAYFLADVIDAGPLSPSALMEIQAIVMGELAPYQLRAE